MRGADVDDAWPENLAPRGRPRQSLKPACAPTPMARSRPVLVVQIDTAIRRGQRHPGDSSPPSTPPATTRCLMVDAIASLGTMPFRDGRHGASTWPFAGSPEGADDPAWLEFCRCWRPQALRKRMRALACAATTGTGPFARGRPALSRNTAARHAGASVSSACAKRPRHAARGRARRQVFDAPPACWLTPPRSAPRWTRGQKEPGARAFNITGMPNIAPIQRYHRASSTDGQQARSRWSTGATRRVRRRTRHRHRHALDGKAFRIAHMGHVNAPMILGTLGVVETALQALGIAHGSSGAGAAAASLSAGLASARDAHASAQGRASMSVTS